MSVSIVLRTLWRAPAFAVTACGTVALAVALSAVVFAVVDGVLFKPLPYAQPERLFQVRGTDGSTTGWLSFDDVRLLRTVDPRIAMTTFASGRSLRNPASPDVTIWSAAVDPQFFELLGHLPLVGGFSAEDYRASDPGEPQPAIITYSLWRDGMGGDASAISRTLELMDARLRVVGVLPRDFVFPDGFGRTRPDILVPLVPTPDDLADRRRHAVTGIARIDPSLPLSEAQARLDSMMASHVGDYRASTRTLPGPYIAVTLRALEDHLGRTERPLFRAAFAGAALLILLGCVNAAGLLAARSRDRTQELLLRVVLGAGRSELWLLLLTEAVLIALAGAIVGLVAARPLLAIALSLLPQTVLLLKSPDIDGRVVAFAIFAATVTMAVVAALSTRSVLTSVLGQGLSGMTTMAPRVRSWARAAMLAGESAIGITLVLAGSLVLTSFVTLRAQDSGFDEERLAILEVLTPGTTRREEQRARHVRVIDRLASMPGVTSVAAIAAPLLESAYAGSGFTPPPGAHRKSVSEIPVAGAFFEVAGLRLLDGRVLSREEIDTGRPFAVVGERTARAYWPESRAVGQVLTADGGKRSITVVGVVEEARLGTQADTDYGEIYVSAAIRNSAWRVFFLRTSRDPALVVREAALAINRDVSGVLVRRAQSLQDALAQSVLLYRFRSALFGSAAAAGLVILFVGVAGLVAMGVARRLREIGIRTALGARRAAITRMVVVNHLWPVLIGTAFGLIGSWWLTRLLSSFLYGIEAHDPSVWTVAATALILTTTVAAWLPARRASGVDPMVVLRRE